MMLLDATPSSAKPVYSEKTASRDFFWKYESAPSKSELEALIDAGENAPYNYDLASGVVEYGYRYYNPQMGRWLNRDPIGENGGLNLYGFVDNDGINYWDYLGLQIYDNTVMVKADYVLTRGVSLKDAFGAGTSFVGFKNAVKDLKEGIEKLGNGNIIRGGKDSFDAFESLKKATKEVGDALDLLDNAGDVNSWPVKVDSVYAQSARLKSRECMEVFIILSPIDVFFTEDSVAVSQQELNVTFRMTAWHIWLTKEQADYFDHQAEKFFDNNSNSTDAYNKFHNALSKTDPNSKNPLLYDFSIRNNFEDRPVHDWGLSKSSPNKLLK